MDWLTWILNGFCFTMGASIGGVIVGFFLRASKSREDKATELLAERNTIGLNQVNYLRLIWEAIEAKHKRA